MQLQQVLGLVRVEAERQQQTGRHLDYTVVDQETARKMIEKIASLVNMVTTCPVEGLQLLSDFATRCQAHRFMQKHCGACQGYDKHHICPACGETP